MRRHVHCLMLFSCEVQLHWSAWPRRDLQQQEHILSLLHLAEPHLTLPYSARARAHCWSTEASVARLNAALFMILLRLCAREKSSSGAISYFSHLFEAAVWHTTPQNNSQKFDEFILLWLYRVTEFRKIILGVVWSRNFAASTRKTCWDTMS